MTKGSFVRVGDGDRRLSSYEVQIMLSSRGQPREDEQSVPGTCLDLLDPVMLEAFVARVRTSRPYAFKDLDRDALLRRARILVTGPDGTDSLSLAALIALGSYPQEHFPQLMISFLHYPPPTGDASAAGTRFLDNVTIEGLSWSATRWRRSGGTCPEGPSSEEPADRMCGNTPKPLSERL
ncbi:hypothetical protein ACWEQG_16550 [Microbispora sp. NPDC004025]